MSSVALRSSSLTLLTVALSTLPARLPSCWRAGGRDWEEGQFWRALQHSTPQTAAQLAWREWWPQHPLATGFSCRARIALKGRYKRVACSRLHC